MTILDDAARLTSGDRNKAYGHPLDDYTCTAALFTAQLRHAGKLVDGAVIEAELAQAMMIAVKLSRLSSNLTHRDSLVDIAGYARTIEMTQEERAKRAELQPDLFVATPALHRGRDWPPLEGYPNPRCAICRADPCTCVKS